MTASRLWGGFSLPLTVHRTVKTAGQYVGLPGKIGNANTEGAVKKVPSKRQAAPNGAACKIYVEKGLVQWKNQPFGVIMNL